MYVHAEYSNKAPQVSALRSFHLTILRITGANANTTLENFNFVLCNGPHTKLTWYFSWCRLPLISVALVEGKALGGGAELTTACDFR